MVQDGWSSALRTVHIGLTTLKAVEGYVFDLIGISRYRRQRSCLGRRICLFTICVYLEIHILPRAPRSPSLFLKEPASSAGL